MPRNESMQSLRRAVKILYAVAGVEEGCSTQRIAERTGLKPNTLHRFLRTLEEEHFLMRRMRPLRFLLGPAVTELKTLDDERHLLSVSGEVLVRFQAKLPVSTFNLVELCRTTNYQRLCVQAERPGLVVQRRDFQVPIYEKASSLLFLAYCHPDEARKIYAAHPFGTEGRPYWKNRLELDAFLTRVRRLGYCQPGVPDSEGPVFRVAAPVFSRGREVIAAVGAFVLLSESSRQKKSLIRLCREAAAEITRRLAETSPAEPGD